MTDQHSIRSAAAHPESCHEYYWADAWPNVEIDLDRAGAGLVRELLTEAWDHESQRVRPGRTRPAN